METAVLDAFELWSMKSNDWAVRSSSFQVVIEEIGNRVNVESKVDMSIDIQMSRSMVFGMR